MPIHHNKDGTWQWGQAGKKYRSRKDALRQMRAIFANGYKEQQDKKASFYVASRASQFLAAVASVGSYGMVKVAANKVVLPYHKYFDPVQIQRGQTLSGIWSQQRKKNPLVPAYKVFLDDWKAQNSGSDKLFAGRTANIPRYMPRKVVKPIQYLKYGTDKSQWDTIERQNKRRAYFNALQLQQSGRDINTVNNGRTAYGIGQLQQQAIDAVKQAIPGWGKNFTAASMLGNLQGSRYAIQKYQDIVNRKVSRFNMPAVNVVDNPRLAYFRYTWGPYAHYNKVREMRKAGLPQQQIRKFTQEQMALQDKQRVAKFMEHYRNQLNGMPVRPVG